MPQQKGVHVRVSTDLEAGLPAVFGAASEIREALTNLVFNAIDAMPDGGVLTLRTCTETAAGPPPRARLVHVEVRDTGTGMDEETRGRCLEPFYTTKGERGTGLGLAMVYGIAQRHAADMEIDSELGRGTTMRLIFPAHAAAVAGAAQPAGRGARPPRARILVVDDDPLVLRSFRDLLESDGHVVEAVSGGQAGIDAFAAALSGNSPFSLVVTDLGMPTVDGRRVAAAIKAAAPSVPVVLLTGWGERLLAEGDVPPHVDRVLGKPPKLREIREALSLLLSPEA